tara:strand:+ start:367 stop:807 length:441 start_codon:yes stop_codon:yes gene_type:complete
MKLLSNYHGEELFGITVEHLPLDKLHVSVPKCEQLFNKQFYQNLTNDISNNGLNFPVIVVEATEEGLRAVKKRYRGAMLEIDPILEQYNEGEKMLIVWGGSQRVRVAEDLGYRTIDAIVFKDNQFREALKRQEDMRKPYMAQYYNN